MRTIKRSAPEISTSGLKELQKRTKYFNHMKWEGIIQEDNIYAISQYSVRDAKNIYVDDSDHLVSRLPLTNEEIGQYALPTNHTLKNILTFGDTVVYVSQYTNNSNILYSINLNNSSTANMTISGISKYHIDKVDQYIICFNDVGAKIFDINNTTAGWQNFSNFVKVPIVKIVSGSSIEEYDTNDFTESYKEQYIWNSKEQSILPSGNGDIEIRTNQGRVEYPLSNMDKFTDYRTLRVLNIELEDPVTSSDIFDLFSVSKDNSVMCVGRQEYFLVSYNGGNSWKRVDYPSDAIGHRVEIASVSEDGLCFFFATNVNGNGVVYRCNLNDFVWVQFNCYTENTTTATSISMSGTRTMKGHFVNSETFAFCNFNTGKLYYKAPSATRVYLRDISTYLPKNANNEDISIYDATEFNGKELDWMNVVCKVYETNNLFISVGLSPNAYGVTNASNTVYLVSCKILYSSANQYTVSVLAQSGSYPVYPISILVNSINEILVTANVLSFISNDFVWQKSEVTFNFSTSSTSSSASTIAPSANFFGPRMLSEGVYLQNFNIVQKNLTGYNTESLPDEITLADDIDIVLYDTSVNNKKEIITANDTFYMIVGNRVLTNYMLEENIITFTYSYISGNEFQSVPDVSYSGTDLYLGFNNLLQITNNTRDEEDTSKILFNLPSKFNQTFISSLNGIMNISTTEVALFFKDNITICAKVSDENFTTGFRYDYYKTKLSMGIRLGDTVMNTLEGSLTIFPTRRGLALMNYQAFMATTDQVITYVSDNIKDLWTAFYDEDGSSNIKIIQWRNHLVITNGKKDILLYNLLNGSWWMWEVPINVEMAITDQIELSVISQLLYKFKEMNVYYDFANTYNETKIEWFIKSQPLHMNAPTYYKNLRQLVFQFLDTEGEEIKNTLNTTIYLYRKKVTEREPETIHFTVEQYRTFVKRFNYWKINEIQWQLSNDSINALPKQLRLNGISVKYELGYEVR